MQIRFYGHQYVGALQLAHHVEHALVLVDGCVHDARDAALTHVVDDVGAPFGYAAAGQPGPVGVYRDDGLGQLAPHDAYGPFQAAPLLFLAHFPGARARGEGADVYHRAALFRYFQRAQGYLPLGLLPAALVEAVGSHVEYPHDPRAGKLHQPAPYVECVVHPFYGVYVHKLHKDSANWR